MNKKNQRLVRHQRIKGRIKGTKERPRLSVHRSNKNLFAQLINDNEGKTLIGLSIKALRNKKKKTNKTEEALLLGGELAKKALKTGVKKVVFDRSGYKYHGRVKALAEGARKGGLEF